MTKQKIYLAGGFKSNWQEKVISQLGDRFIFFNPRGHEFDDPNFYAAWDIHHVKNCEILFAYMEKANPSGYGLAFEVGLAHGLNKTIFLVDERSGVDKEFSNYFKLVRFPSSVIFSTLEEGIEFLRKF